MIHISRIPSTPAYLRETAVPTQRDAPVPRSDRSDISVAATTKLTSPSAAPFSAVSLRRGQYGVNGRYMSGTEDDGLLAANGRLYAVLGNWMNVPGKDPVTGPEVLEKDLVGCAVARGRDVRPEGQREVAFCSSDFLARSGFGIDASGKPLSTLLMTLDGRPGGVFKEEPVDGSMDRCYSPGKNVI